MDCEIREERLTAGGEGLHLPQRKIGMKRTDELMMITMWSGRTSRWNRERMGTE